MITTFALEIKTASYIKTDLEPITNCKGIIINSFPHKPTINFSMKKIAILLFAFCASVIVQAMTPDEAWKTLYPEIEKQIKAPTFRDKDYKIFDYGKKSKTKGFLYTELINKVIDKCSQEGGGRRHKPISHRAYPLGGNGLLQLPAHDLCLQAGKYRHHR